MTKLEILQMWEATLYKQLGLFEELESKNLIVTEQDLSDNLFEKAEDPGNDDYAAHFDNREDWSNAEINLQLVQSLIEVEKKKAKTSVREVV